MSCCSDLIFEIIVFFAFRREYVQQFLSEALKVLSKSLFVAFSMFLVFLYLFKFFLDYFARFFSFRIRFEFETKTNSTNANSVNFYTVFLFLWSIPSCFLYFKCSIVLFIFLAKKQRWSGGKTQKEQSTATEHSALLRHNACALANQNCLLYPTYIVIINNLLFILINELYMLMIVIKNFMIQTFD